MRVAAVDDPRGVVGVLTTTLTRLRPQVVRWHWRIETTEVLTDISVSEDGAIITRTSEVQVHGWSFTKRGATKAAERARAEHLAELDAEDGQQ